MLDKLRAFVHNERSGLSSRGEMLFGGSFSQVIRYYEFLPIIVPRYQKASQDWTSALREFMDSLMSGNDANISHPMTPHQESLHDASTELGVLLHLEIESFYLLAKVLLDRTADALQLYFGPERGLPLSSHHRLEKNFEAYATSKDLTLPDPRLREIIGQLQDDLVEFRDKHIVHQRSPRTIWGTGFHQTGDGAWLSSSRLYPREGDPHVQTQDLSQMLSRIDGYLCGILDYISANRAKTILRPPEQDP